jgi:hypothetical protein
MFAVFIHRSSTDNDVKNNIILDKNIKDVLNVKSILVIFEGKEYIMLIQYASGYCEIIKQGEPNHKIKLVHFSELKLKGA